MKLNTKPLILMGLASALVVSCKSENKEEMADAVEKVPGINLAYMDTTVGPNQDFFRYVNGTWLKTTEIPDDMTRWGGFNELRRNTDKDVLSILSRAEKDSTIDFSTDQGKAVAMYMSIMDTVARNSSGIAPLKPYLDEINAIADKEALKAYLVKMTPVGGNPFFGVGVGADAKDSNKNMASLGAADLGLPDRDYYLKDDPKSVEIRDKYKAHVSRMLQMTGVSQEEADVQAQDILNFETQLARELMDKVERRDPQKRYNPTAIAQLGSMAPVLDWKAFFETIGAAGIDTVNVGQPKYLKALPGILKTAKLPVIKSYLYWTAVNGASGSLSMEMERANWEFYARELTGAKEQRPLDERALQTVNWTLGEALGKLYVGEKFPAEAKTQAKEMIANIIKAYESRIKALPWMDSLTKEKAIEKLKKTTIKVGYPDKWKDYSALEVKRPADGGSYFENSLSAARWNFNRNIEKLGKPVDKSEWFMAPQIVNAYYNPSYNEIVFPAAILQPPFFNFTADAAVNYGGIGSVIGHEISHGFDDSGADYDADGNLVNWWTEKDLAEFNRLGDSLAAQYSRIEVLPDVFINGKFTLGENIGDLGGVNAAYDGLKLYLSAHGDPGMIDGFTPEQRFFMSWATVWRTKIRDEALRNQILTDPHSPGMNRAVQPLKNIDAFYEAFNVKEGDSMYLAPEKRVKIW